VVLDELENAEEGGEAVHVIGKHLRLDCSKQEVGDPAELNQRRVTTVLAVFFFGGKWRFK
jgi:hypothetical protein